MILSATPHIRVVTLYERKYSESEASIVTGDRFLASQRARIQGQTQKQLRFRSLLENKNLKESKIHGEVSTGRHQRLP